MGERLKITPCIPQQTTSSSLRHIFTCSSEKIKKPTYDHNTGTFGEWEDFEPTPIVIVEGLHTLYDGIRDYVDFKIFVDPARVLST